MSKFDALPWVSGCGSCGGSGFKFFCEVKKGAADGLLIKIGHDDVITVSEWKSGAQTRDAEVMTKAQVELLL
jgi:hypothetical protein